MAVINNNNNNSQNIKTTTGEGINQVVDIKTTDIAADLIHKTGEAETKGTNTTKEEEDIKEITKPKGMGQTHNVKLFAGSVTSLAISKLNATNAFHQKAL